MTGSVLHRRAQFLETRGCTARRWCLHRNRSNHAAGTINHRCSNCEHTLVLLAAAQPPAPGRVGTGATVAAAGPVEVAFDLTLTPGAQSKASVNLACQDTDTFAAPFNFLLIDIRPDGRIIATRYDNAAATQQPATFFDRGFSNQDRFDVALLHPRTRVALRCQREGQTVHIKLSLDGTVVMDATTPALAQAGDGFTLYMTTFNSGFRDAAELLIDNVAVTKI